MIAEEKRVTIPFIKSILKPVVDLIHTKANAKDVYAKTELADVAVSGSYEDLTGAPELADVATSGSYADLSGTPDISKDWNQNDETANDYIKNRPFYTIGSTTTTTEILPESTYNSNTDNFTLNQPLIEGTTYTVVWGGVSYNCVAREYGGYIMIGNNAIYEYDGDINTDTGEPFAMEIEGTDTNLYVYVEDQNETVFSISHIETHENLVKIDEKYIPDSIPKMELQAAEGVPETTIEVTDNDLGSPITDPFTAAFEVGVEYVVIWDAVEYKCVAYELEGANVLGNAAIPGIGSDTGEPFCIASLGGQVMLFVAEAGTHTISIGGQETYKIRKEDLPDLNTTVVGYVESRGSYGMYQLDTTLGASATEILTAINAGRECVIVGSTGDGDPLKMYYTGTSLERDGLTAYVFVGTGVHQRYNSDNYTEFVIRSGVLASAGFFSYESKWDTEYIMESGSTVARHGKYTTIAPIKHYKDHLVLTSTSGSKEFTINVDDTGMPTITDTSDETNVWSPTNVEIDTTLSVEGAAADAKAVGDALAETGVWYVHATSNDDGSFSLDKTYDEIMAAYDAGRKVQCEMRFTADAGAGAYIFNLVTFGPYAPDPYDGDTVYNGALFVLWMQNRMMRMLVTTDNQVMMFQTNRFQTEGELQIRYGNELMYAGHMGVDVDIDLNIPINAPKDYVAFTDQVNGYIYYVSMRNGTLVSTCAIETIEVASMPTTVEYTAGDAFDPSGLTLRATRYDGTPVEVTDFTYDAPSQLTEDVTSIPVTYTDMGVTYTVDVPITVNPFDPEVILADFEYTDNGDGTYTITGWKGTNNGEASTEMIIPNYSCIIV